MQTIKGAGQVHSGYDKVVFFFCLETMPGEWTSSVLSACVRLIDCYWKLSKFSLSQIWNMDKLQVDLKHMTRGWLLVKVLQKLLLWRDWWETISGTWVFLCCAVGRSFTSGSLFVVMVLQAALPTVEFVNDCAINVTTMTACQTKPPPPWPDKLWTPSLMLQCLKQAGTRRTDSLIITEVIIKFSSIIQPAFIIALKRTYSHECIKYWGLRDFMSETEGHTVDVSGILSQSY